MTSLLPDSVFDEVLGLTLACLSGEASPADVERLNELLCNEAARCVYEDVIRDSFGLRRWADATKLHCGEIFDGCDSDTAFLRLASAEPDFIAATASSSREGEPHDTVPGFPVGILTTTFPTTVGYFSSGWPVAYLAATAILRDRAVDRFFGACVRAGAGRQAIRPSLPSPPPSMVGRITGMVDCSFDGSSDISRSKTQDPRPKTPVFLGDKIALASGLMEITYDTGAKVILQGPVRYEVESVAGGYLSVGKLTARVESGEWRVESKSPNLQVSKSPNPSLSTLHSPLFTIKTPTATVTDLGTEFGIEVAKSGETTSHVFRGSVRLQVVDGGNNTATAARVLHENESARVERAPSDRSGPRKLLLSGWPPNRPASSARFPSRRSRCSIWST